MAFPLPVYNFSVDFGGTKAEFSEVTGLNIEVQPIEYRHGLEKEGSMFKKPGLKKFGNITLKRGVFPKDNEFYDWYTEVNGDDEVKRNLTIQLLDEKQQPVMEWQVRNAFPTKITSPDLKASGNEVAVESIEIAHEGLTVVNA